MNKTFKKIKNNVKRNWRKYLEIVTDVSDIMVHLGRNPTKSGMASIGLKLVNSYSKYTSDTHAPTFYNPFTSKEWVYINLGACSKPIVDILIEKYKSNFKTICQNEDGRKYCLIDIDPIAIGFYMSADYASGFHVLREQYDKTLNLIGKCFWEHYSVKNLTIVGQYDERNESYIADIYQEENKVLSSKESDKIYDRINKFLNCDLNRSIMLFGPPGTGKSVAINYIVNKLNLKTIKISCSDEYFYEHQQIICNIIDTLEPEAFIIDDFDRIMRPEKLLTELEKINDSIKLFLVSVNNTNRFDDAVIRPGRFDDIIDFYHLGDEVYEKLIGDDIDQESKLRLKKLPVAYIYDFHKRKKALGIEVAIDEIKQLESRAQRFDHLSVETEEVEEAEAYDDDDYDEEEYHT